MRTLIVEDNKDTGQLLQMIVEVYGEVEIAFDGLEALQALRQTWDTGQHYDLILLDVRMPRMDGLETLRCLREEEDHRSIIEAQRAKVIMLTAYADEQNMQLAFQLGCQGYIFKTQGKAKILQRLRALGLIE